MYPNLTATQKRRIRDSVFDDMTQTQIRLQTPLNVITALMTEVDNLAAFVTANQVDFVADGTLTDLVAARNAVRDAIVTAIDAINGISATRP